MTESDSRRAAAAFLQRNETKAHALPALLGFDGFIDEIVRIVDKKTDAGELQLVPSIPVFAERAARAAGKSTNMQLSVQQVKLGGNGPIMANALGRLGAQVTYIGNLGYPDIHPVFRDFAQRAQVFSVADPGHTDALEFDDGKIMLGKYEVLADITYKNIVKRVGKSELDRIWRTAAFIGMVNWTMIDTMTGLWEALLENHCDPLGMSPTRYMMIDLADPERRTASDLVRGLETAARFQGNFRVILGCNEKESHQIADALDLPASRDDMQGLQQRAMAIRERLQIECVVIHPVRFAVAATTDAQAGVSGPYVAQPKISTGAGDHFNAGFSLALTLGAELEHALLAGVGTSGYYVRTAESPGIGELVAFLGDWED